MGTEEFWIPAALTALSAGAQYENQASANSRAQSGEVQSIIDQQKLQQQGNNEVKQLTNQIATNTPDQLAAKATGQYVDTLRKNAAGTGQGGSGGAAILFGAPTSSLPTNIKGSSRYNADTAGSQNQVEQYGNELAGEMGQIDAATRQRQNEGLEQNTLSTNLNLLGPQSYTQNFVDQLRTQAAGQQSPWVTLLSGALGGAGNTLSKNMTPATTPASTALYGNGQVTGGLGVTQPSVNPWFDTSGQSNP